MNNAFARRMTELRRKKGITQKQAAASLGISQALLSHYEKGARECGLDFLIRAAAFYQVSCDYLLGIEKKGSGKMTKTMREQQRLQAADRILFDLVEKTGSEQLVNQASDFLALAYYRLYHQLISGGQAAGGRTYTRRALADAATQMVEAELQCVLNGVDIGNLQAVDATSLHRKESDMEQAYGSDYILLTELLQKAEKQFKER